MFAGINHQASTFLPWLGTAALSVLLYLVRFGYGFGFSDQDDFIPVVLAITDPELFTSDWYVQGQLDYFNPRTVVVWVLSLLSRAGPIEWVVGFLYIAVWLAISLAVFRLALFVTETLLAAAIAVPLVLVLTPQWTLGGNDLIHRIFVPSMMSWAFVLLALVAALARRPVRSSVLASIGLLPQVLVGLYGGMASLLCLIVADYPRLQVRRLLQLVVPFLLVATLVMTPILLDLSAGDYDTFTRLRLSHHYLPWSFPRVSFAKFGGIALAGIVSGILVPVVTGVRAGYLKALSMLMIFLVLAAVGFACVFFAPESFLVRLQPSKLTVLAKTISLCMVAGAVAVATPLRVHHFFGRIMRTYWVTPLLVAITAGYFVMQFDHIVARAEPGIAPDRDALISWIRDSTPEDATFLVGPSNSWFRTRARRGVVINYKSIPFTPDRVADWYERLSDVSTTLTGDTKSDPSRLDRAYESRSGAEIMGIACRYGAEYILRIGSIDDIGSGLTLEHRSDTGLIYSAHLARCEDDAAG